MTGPAAAAEKVTDLLERNIQTFLTNIKYIRDKCFSQRVSQLAALETLGEMDLPDIGLFTVVPGDLRSRKSLSYTPHLSVHWTFMRYNLRFA